MGQCDTCAISCYLIAVFLRESRRRPICDAEKKLKHEMSTLAEPTAWAMWLFGAAALGAYAHREQLRTGSDSTAAKPQPASSSRPTKDVGQGRRSRFQDAQATPIYCAVDARGYEDAAKYLARDDDVVLEIGCQLNHVTKALSERARRVIGVDINRKGPTSQKMDKQTYYRQPGAPMPHNVTLHVMDVWDLRAMHAAAVGDCQIILVEPSVLLGHDLAFEVLALVRALSRLCPHARGVVVKSRSLSQLQQQLRAAPSSRPLGRGGGGGGARMQPPLLIAADLVHDYRAAAMQCVEHLLAPGECALEIGAHVGATTWRLHAELSKRGGGGCVGVDVSDSIIQRARGGHPEVCFEVADAWDIRSLLAALDAAASSAGGASGGEGMNARIVPPLIRQPALLLVDVGGLSGASGTLDALALMRTLCACFHTSLKAVVIKSSCMRTLAKTLRSSRELSLGSVSERGHRM